MLILATKMHVLTPYLEIGHGISRASRLSWDTGCRARDRSEDLKECKLGSIRETYYDVTGV